MKILFLTHYFPPEVNAPARRTFEHGRAWANSGHQVIVITCFPSHPRGKVYAGYRRRVWQWDEMSGIRVLRVWTVFAANEGMVTRTLNYVSFMIAAVIAGWLLPRVDVVISTSPQFFCGIAGFFVAKAKRNPWVLEIRDLWPESISAVGALRNRALLRRLEAIEAWAYRRADHVIALTSAFRDHIVACGADPAAISIVPNGVDLARFRPMAGTPPPDLGLSGKFVVSYFGTHGMAHGLELVLRAADRLRQDHTVAFLLVGDGAARRELLAKRDAMELENVVMLPQQPSDEMPALWQACDAALVCLADHPVFTTVIPSKIFEAMAAAKPILLCVRGEAAELVKAADCGIVIPPEDDAVLADVVRQLAETPDRAREMGTQGRSYCEQHFDRADLAQQLEILLQDVVARSGKSEPLDVGD